MSRLAHVPHVYIPGPWGDAPALPLPDGTFHHLDRVLRRSEGAAVTYTDGDGTRGEGRLVGRGVERGDETMSVRPASEVRLGVAVPHRTERARFVVEKLAELGVDRLVWLDTRFGEGRAPAPSKTHSWAVAALEQSRGSRLLRVDGPVTVAELAAESGDGRLFVADPVGGPLRTAAAANAGPSTVLIGPEGGFAPGEVPSVATAVTLGSRILRTETAAIVAAALILEAAGRI